ncbi:MAG: cellulase family glycosylhydrolase [Bacteroidales bacterium]|nr:cellulase family glycosylhydrolase [Bacteroidales bacterium]MBN2820971.1 cellulase family glycosylhydrolase [Bacteroidales bacterium]
MKNTLFIMGFLLSSLLSLSFGQLTPAEAVIQMSRGINMGNTLEPPDEGGWNNPLAEEYYFDDYVAAGFKTVRIPVRWDEHTLESLPYTVDEDWMNRVEQLVDWALERKLFVVINAHHEEFLKNNPSLENLERFDSIWSQIANRFQNKSDSLLFEMLNEPHPIPKDTVDNLNERVLSIIRKTNPTRIVIFSGHSWSNSDELMSTRIPNDEYLMGYFHSYDPWSFGGQSQGTWGSISDKSFIKTKFDNVQNWSEQNNIPVLLGEFGAISVYDGTITDFNSRMRHYAYFVEQSLEHNFCFTVWDDGGDFGIYNRASRNWQIMKDILINFSVKNPNLLVSKNMNGDYVELSWENRTDNHDSIFIERGLSPVSMQKIDAIAPGVVKYEDYSVEQFRNYYYRVVAHYNDSTDLMSYPTTVYTEHESGVYFDKNSSSVQIFPNPLRDYLNIKSLDEEILNKLEVYSITGSNIANYVLNGQLNNIYLGYLQNGLYIVRVKTDKSDYAFKLEKL